MRKNNKTKKSEEFFKYFFKVILFDLLSSLMMLFLVALLGLTKYNYSSKLFIFRIEKRQNVLCLGTLDIFK